MNVKVVPSERQHTLNGSQTRNINHIKAQRSLQRRNPNGNATATLHQKHIKLSRRIRKSVKSKRKAL